jgi:hypothetical protein
MWEEVLVAAGERASERASKQTAASQNFLKDY